ncbi:MAG TPA: hypothetical protein VLA49_21525 [Anaerolineales bacterium]|nr:hypothetical protein [Anaerolineales bacterium]
MSSEFARHLRGWFAWLGYILLSLLLIALGEWLPLMPAVQRFQEAHPSLNRALIGVTLAMTVLGTLLLAFTQFLVRVPDPRQAPLVYTGKAQGSEKGRLWFFSGLTISAGFSDEVRFWRLRKAFQDGDWWRVPRWRRFTLMMLAAILLFYGLFGFLLLLFPPGVKFILFLAVLYATVRSVYAFAVDRPFRNEADGEG